MLTVDMISLMSRYESSRSLWLGIPGNVGWMLVSGMLVGWITNSQQTLCKLEVQLSSFVSCFHARVVCFCPSLGYAGSTDLSSSSFTAVIHGYSMNSLPSQWNSRYRGGHRCPFLTPNRNFQAFHLCFRGTSNDWHAEFQSFVMINVRCCLCVLDFKKRQEALQEPLVVLNWWNLVNISMETFCIWSFALPIVSFHDFSICFSPWFLHVSTISTHICVVLQDTLW